MAAFPTNPSVADTHTIGEKSWDWNGYAWDRQASASSSDSHGHTGEDVVDSFNGLTGDVNTSGLVLHVAGISSDGGITVGGMNIGGVSERLVSSTDVDDFVNFGPNKFEVYQNNARMFKADGTRTYIGSNSSPKDLYVYGELHGVSVINAQAGISLDAAGITFPDGTFQSTAASAGGGGITQSIGFILDGNGSPLTTGEKLDALKQVPYGSSVLSTAAYIQDGVSGTDKTIVFSVKKASALSSAVSGITLEIGATASADQTGFTFDGIGGGINFRTLASVSNTSGSTIGAGEWIYPVITGNSGDINKLQIFMTVIPT